MNELTRENKAGDIKSLGTKFQHRSILCIYK